ncbi:MAG: serine/threonine-protein kinase, partial [Pseudomonadota bacterium]
MIGALASLDQIGDRLGSGGQGMVFHATRSGEGFQQRGALKVLVGRLANDDSLRRFKRERRLLASLDHPGIPTLLDGGVLDDGSPWLVVELVDGQILSDRLKHGVLSPRAAADLVINLCGILSHAHQRLIAHLDLKPGNVMLEPGGGVRLLDFGVARLLDDASGHTEQTGAAFTPAFAAPEQIDLGPTGTATDIY